MTNRAESGAEHRRAWDAIPWMVNGSASDEQRRAVEAHLSDCDDCREELVRQRRLHAAMSQPPAGVPDPEPGLARLMARIDDAARPGAWAGAAGTTPPRRRMGLGALACGLVGAVVIEAVGIAFLAFDRRADAEPYRTLTQAAATAPRATLRIVPAPTMTLAELQRLLLDLRLQVVAGPNEAGAYSLAPLAQPPSIESQLARLRATPGLRFAEPIGAPEAPR